jgi:hypothetical protein
MPSVPPQTPVRGSLLAQLGGTVVLSIPLAVLILAVLRAGGPPSPLLAGGVATISFLTFGLVNQVGLAHIARHKTASPLYLIGMLALWLSVRDYNEQFMRAAMGVLLGVPLALFIFQEFIFTGAGSLRRARSLVRRLANKTDWPEDLADCKLLPEVKALREALRDNAEPVLVLLGHPDAHVRVAALAALEFRPSWAKGQAEAVLRAAKFATEPPVRVAAMMALANVEEQALMAAIAVYLRDATVEVRRAAVEALLWDAELRWAKVRLYIHATLADVRCMNDGPLPCSGGFPATAVADLTAWSSESGPSGLRSAKTLVIHFRREFEQNLGPELIAEVTARIRSTRTPANLRVELAHLLGGAEFADEKLWRELLDPTQPSALRLLAAGSLLRSGPDDAALEALREVAHIPNREITLRVALIIQKSLRIDMGLPLDGPMPHPQSKQAAEIAQRVLDWVAGRVKPLADRTAARRDRMAAWARHIPRPSGEPPRRRQ